MDNEFLLGQLAASMKNMEANMMEIKEHLKSCPVKIDLSDHLENHKAHKNGTKYTITTIIAVLALIMQPILKIIWK